MFVFCLLMLLLFSLNKKHCLLFNIECNNNKRDQFKCCFVKNTILTIYIFLVSFPQRISLSHVCMSKLSNELRRSSPLLIIFSICIFIKRFVVVFFYYLYMYISFNIVRFQKKHRRNDLPQNVSKVLLRCNFEGDDYTKLIQFSELHNC